MNSPKPAIRCHLTRTFTLMGIVISLMAAITFIFAMHKNKQGRQHSYKVTNQVPSHHHLAFMMHSARSQMNALSRSLEPAWVKRQNEIQEQINAAIATRRQPGILFVGDSITQGWGHNLIWQRFYNPRGAINAGIASDRVQHILWRVQRSRLDLLKPKVVVLLGGTNNLALDQPALIASGLNKIIQEIRSQSPTTQILVLGIFPSGQDPAGKRRVKTKLANTYIQRLADGQNIHYLDIGTKFLERDGRIAKTTMFDYLHLTLRGYQIWAKAMEPDLNKLLGRQIASGT